MWVKYQVLFRFSRPFLAKWLCPKALVRGTLAKRRILAGLPLGGKEL